MLFSNEISNTIYKNLYSWLSAHSVNSCTNKSTFSHYQKNIWQPIINKITLLKNTKNLTAIEKDFLDTVLYKGYIYRLQSYNPKLKGYVCPLPYYQSWSKDIVGLSQVKGYHGDAILLKSITNLGIDIFGLLAFLIKHKYITDFNNKDPKTLLSYECENEIASLIEIEKIEKVYIVDANNLLQSIKKNKLLPRKKWIRNNLC